MRINKHTTRALIAGAGASAFIALSAGSAAADSGATLWTVWPDRRAHAQFTSAGEIFEVWDDEADGAAAIVWYTVGTTEGYCTNNKGAGTKKTCDLSFANGRRIEWGLWAWDQDGSHGGHMWVSETKVDQT